MRRDKVIGVILILFSLLFAGDQSKVQPDVSKTLILESVKEFTGEIQELQEMTIPVADIYSSVRSKLKILKNRTLDTLHISLFKYKGKQIIIIPVQSKGKTLDFSFLVYIDLQSDKIENVDVVEYRETYGMEIDYPVFRKQFKGKNDPRQIIFRRHIRNITGATISARSITMAIRDILVVYNNAKSRILNDVQ